MSLPERVRVRLISDDAGYISSARVVQREFTMPELLEALLAVAGKDVERLRQLLQVGSISVGGYRHRWEPLRADAADIAPLLARFPDPQPDRPFAADRCVFASITAGVETLEVTREQADRRTLLRRQSFWTVLMEIAAARPPRYQTYSYHYRADVYLLEPTSEEQNLLREAAPLLRLDRLEERIRLQPIRKITLLVNR